MKTNIKLLSGKLENWLDDLELKNKLRGLYIFCVLFPLIITDTFILQNMIGAEQTKQRHDMQNLSSAVQYSLSSTVEYSATAAKNIYMNTYIEDYLNEQYKSPYYYMVAYQDFMKNSLFRSSMAVNNTKLTIYADNETILNGGQFGRLSSVLDSPWYQKLSEREEDVLLYFYFDNWKSPAYEAKRKIVFLRKLNLITHTGCEKVLKIEIDYNSVVRQLENMNYDSAVYICKGGKILLSNQGYNSVGQDFEPFTLDKKIAYKQDFTLYGENLQIYILKRNSGTLQVIWQNLPMLLMLLLINILLPWFLMSLINRSVTLRIRKLSQAFESVDQDRLRKIEDIHGTDEIGSLMTHYNQMADRTNELIQTVYKDKLKEQEMDIARKNAELLALHSQINPHFLFNALESIRMHSVLRREFETADMVEKLAIMERQNVDWSTDTVTTKKEMEFVEAYLGLQRYRFGERLSFRLEVEPDCENIQIPKLTIVTFVENACVHGIESKTSPGWIFVRIYRTLEDFCIEVEDTGEGMEETMVADLLDRMHNAGIKQLKEKGRVGMLNACLRIRMITDNTAHFLIESEKGVGTMIQIRIPIDRLLL